MFYHDDGIPDEGAFIEHLMKMSDGETVSIPDGMKIRDAQNCIRSADSRSHQTYKRKKRTVLASSDWRVKFVFNLPHGYSHKIDMSDPWEIGFWKQAIETVKKKRPRWTYQMNGDVLVVLDHETF